MTTPDFLVGAKLDRNQLTAIIITSHFFIFFVQSLSSGELFRSFIPIFQ